MKMFEGQVNEQKARVKEAEPDKKKVGIFTLDTGRPDQMFQEWTNCTNSMYHVQDLCEKK